MREVVIVQRIVCEYRKAFFRILRKELSARGIRLRLISGSPRQGEEEYDVLDDLPFGERKATTYFHKKICWIHGLVSTAKAADLIILTQENAALYTYPFLVMRLFGKKSPRLGFWGHGANMGRVNASQFLDGWREFWLRQVDWWFAYTSKTMGILIDAKFSADKITVVNNSTDTAPLRVSVNEKRGKVESLFSTIFGCTRSRESRVGVFCGRLVESKMILFLLDSIKQIRAIIPEFYMIILGDGPLRKDVVEFCAVNPWCKWVGPKWGIERSEYLAVSDIWLNPGAVGLAVTDAFASALPLATTDNGMHGPEISYLEHGNNGLITNPVVGEYVDSITGLLSDSGLLLEAKAKASDEGMRYSAENMAGEFAKGIDLCLSHQEKGMASCGSKGEV